MLIYKCRIWLHNLSNQAQLKSSSRLNPETFFKVVIFKGWASAVVNLTTPKFYVNLLANKIIASFWTGLNLGTIYLLDAAFQLTSFLIFEFFWILTGDVLLQSLNLNYFINFLVIVIEGPAIYSVSLPPKMKNFTPPPSTCCRQNVKLRRVIGPPLSHLNRLLSHPRFKKYLLIISY